MVTNVFLCEKGVLLEFTCNYSPILSQTTAQAKKVYKFSGFHVSID